MPLGFHLFKRGWITYGGNTSLDQK